MTRYLHTGDPLTKGSPPHVSYTTTDLIPNYLTSSSLCSFLPVSFPNPLPISSMAGILYGACMS